MSKKYFHDLRNRTLICSPFHVSFSSCFLFLLLSYFSFSSLASSPKGESKWTSIPANHQQPPSGGAFLWSPPSHSRANGGTHLPALFYVVWFLFFIPPTHFPPEMLFLFFKGFPFPHPFWRMMASCIRQQLNMSYWLWARLPTSFTCIQVIACPLAYHSLALISKERKFQSKKITMDLDGTCF